jgi:hypothetical protein
LRTTTVSSAVTLLLLPNVARNNGGREVTPTISPCVTAVGFFIAGRCVTTTGRVGAVGRFVTAEPIAVVIVGRCVTETVGVVTFGGGRTGLLVDPGTISLANSSEGDSPEISGFFLGDSKLIAKESINHTQRHVIIFTSL